MDVRIDQAPGQKPRRRTAERAASRPVPETAASFAPPPILLQVPDLDEVTEVPPVVGDSENRPAAKELPRESSPTPWETRIDQAELAFEQQATTAVAVELVDDVQSLDDEYPPAQRMPKLPPVLQRAGSYRASPTVLLGVIVVVLCLAALPLLRDNGGDMLPPDRSLDLAEEVNSDAWPGAPKAAIALGETADKDATTVAAQETSPSDNTSPESESATLADQSVDTPKSLAEANPAASKSAVETSAWPRKQDHTPVAQFEGTIVTPTFRAQHERVGSSIH
ncbi:MAG: hypothetical protein KDA42_06850 [Planctomycetales bacterium]|nr:hypothetical protein [Planctomycetales bacterium]